MNNIYKNFKTLFIALLLCLSGMTALFAQYPEGAIQSLFSVSDTSSKVCFSQGNLQYIGSAGTPYWKFADNQWDYLGTTTDQNSSNQNVDRDLFGWATSGYNHGATAYQPWSTSVTGTDYYAYGNTYCNLFSRTGQAEWGYNAILNGGNQENSGWRTLTYEEWEYVFNTRNTASGIRYAKAKVNNINGVILLPDDWSTEYYTLNNTNTDGARYSTNIITAEQWGALDQHGAVFLPAAGIRDGNSVFNLGSEGHYWSSSCYNEGYYINHARALLFFNSSIIFNNHFERYRGMSVRLVFPPQYSVDINAIPSPVGGGTVSGAGAYSAGAECTLTASASAGYTFLNWTENGVIISTDSVYTFVVWAERNIMANFVAEGNINFADANVKAICVANWDSNGDEELSYYEAAFVTDLGNVFKNNTTIQSFNELQYFIYLSSIGEQAFYGCTALTQVTIPERVTIIGNKAFWNCPALQTVNYNAVNCTSMQSGGSHSVFSSNGSGGAPALKRVVIGSEVQRIPAYAFKDGVDIYPGVTIRSSVTAIGAHAFENCSSITALSFQNNSNLATIGEYAFKDCSALNRALNLPNSVETVGNYAFNGCSSIPSLTIGADMKTIGAYAFWNCPALAMVNFNATNCTSMVTNSQYSVFNSGTNDGGATPIATLSIGNNVTYIPDYAFRNSPNITHAITIPDATTYIGQYAFHGIQSSELTIGTDVASIGDYAFWNCPNLATVNFNAINCTNMVTNSQYSVFNSGTNDGGATPIATLSIGNNVTYIPDYAFRNSPNITHAITIPDATTYIGQYAFHGVQSSELTIGTGVVSIGGYAFWNCPNLATVSFNATNCTSMVTNSRYSVFNSSTSDGTASSIVTLTIGENVTNIPDYAFRFSSNALGNLQLPSGLTNIGQYAFDGCGGFTDNLAIPNSVTTLGQYAFNNCSGFNGTLTLPANESITTINQYTFNGCSGLTDTLTIPANVTEVAHSAFRGCSGFTGALVLHDAMTTIGQYAFYGCSNISELTIGESVTTIGDYAFWNCPNMATIHFNATHCTSMVTNSQYSVFGTSNGGATPIVTLTIGENVTSIPAYAFRYSNNMTCDITIPDAVTSIGQYAFQGCSGFMGDLKIPNAVTTLGKYAFSGCSGFDGSLVIGRGIQTINESTFANCSGFSGALILGTQVNSIGNNAFQNCSAFALVISENPNPITATSSSFTAMNYSIPVYVPDGLVGNYQNATGWSNFTNYIKQYTFWDNLDNANWSDEMNWLSMELPTANDVVCIAYNCDIDIDVNVLHAYVLNLNDVLTVKSGHALNTTYGLGILQPSQLVIEDGAQILNTLPGVQGTMQKHIDGYGTGNDGWYLIASPLAGSIAPETVGNIFSAPEYDLYRFNQSTAAEWENYKTHTDDFFFENGTGYLYASQAEVTLAFAGTLNHESSKEVALSYDDNATLKGFNLVGNPFTCNAYLSNGEQYLEMNGDGSGFVLAESSIIPPMKGIFIEAAPDQDVVTFVTERPDSSGKSVTLRLNSNRGTNMDAVRVRLDGGKDMTKLVLNENSAKLYIPQNGKDYTVVNAPADNQMPVNFKTGTQGTYTLNVEIENASFGYLHLIDNLTGSDVDLLANPSYTFEAKPTDYAARFTLVFAESTGVEENTDAPFAFISNGNIIIPDADAETTVQIVDVTGRVIVSSDVARNVSTNGMTPGVYVVRLISGDNMKTQKVVVK